MQEHMYKRPVCEGDNARYTANTLKFDGGCINNVKHTHMTHI